MQRKDYNKTAVIMHWILAISIFFLFISSWWMLSLPLSSKEYHYRDIPFQLHKNIGMTLFFVLLTILYVRLRHRIAPITSAAMKPWMHKLATADHVFLYLTIFITCLSGYLSSAFSGWPTTLWWLVELPDWGYKSSELNMFFTNVHVWATRILLATVTVHIAGALYHAFRRDGIVRRMLHL